jgi:protease I
MSRKLLFIAGDFVEDYEIMVPFQALEAVGFEVEAVCPEKEAGERVTTAVHDFRGDQTYLEERGHDFRLTESFDDVDLDDYDGLVLPGGRAPEYLRTHDEVIETVQHFFGENKPVAATCHAVLILAAADVLEGRTCTGYADLRHDAEAAGAEWAEGPTVDGNLVTAQDWTQNAGWIREFLGVMGTEVRHGEPITADD